jgi:hypothetical protein
MDSDSQVRDASSLKVHVASWLRDEEAIVPAACPISRAIKTSGGHSQTDQGATNLRRDWSQRILNSFPS